MSSSSSSIWSSNYTVFGTRRGRQSGVEQGVQCDCGIDAPVWEAWKPGTKNPGRRFFGCSRYKDRKLNCNYFEWADPPYTSRAIEVIHSLMEKLSAKFDEVMILRDDLEAAKNKNGKIGEVEMEVEILKKQVEVKDSSLAVLKQELALKNTCMVVVKKELWTHKIALKLGVVFFVMAWVFIFYV